MKATTHRDEIARLLTAQYPRVHRLAIGLCGDTPSAAAVTRAVFILSLSAHPRWRSDIERDNWFLHHTLLESRRQRSHGWLAVGADHPQLLAFARALAALPFQQKEAFILTHGEKLDLRPLAIAMDCSTTAAGNHLNAAMNRLRAVAGPGFDALIRDLAAVYLAPPPPGDLIITQSVRAAARRRVRRVFAGVLLALIAIAAAWLGCKIYGMLDY